MKGWQDYLLRPHVLPWWILFAVSPLHRCILVAEMKSPIAQRQPVLVEVIKVGERGRRGKIWQHTLSFREMRASLLCHYTQ